MGALAFRDAFDVCYVRSGHAEALEGFDNIFVARAWIVFHVEANTLRLA